MAAVLAWVAVGTAGIAGLSFSRWIVTLLSRKQHFRQAVFGSSSIVSWLLIHGVAPLGPLARWLGRFGAVRVVGERISREVRKRGLRTRPETVVSLILGVLVIVGVLLSVVTGTPVCGVAVDGAIVVALVSSCNAAADRDRAAVRAQLPDALRAMAVCSQAGLSLQQTLEQTATETTGQLRKYYESAARKLILGETPTEALAAFRQQRGLPELAFVAVALDVQHQCGGSLASILESAGDAVDGELELERSLKVQTAQAKLSARIVTLMPFLLIAAFTLVSSDFLAPFFSSPAGVFLLGLALAMQTAGVLLVRSMLRIEVDS